MVRFIALSGTTEVTENLYVYESSNDLIIVDCGVGFPEPEMFGVDLVIPDFDYIRKNRSKLRGVLITHGHEDHIGALPFLLSEIKAPVFSTRLVAGFIEEKLRDYNFNLKDFDIRVFDPDKDTISLGVFKITPFRISHSVPDGVGFAIDTPEGKIFHVADYKFDWTPVDGRPFDIAKLAMLASGGALAAVSDCLGSNTPGYTESEKGIEERIEKIVVGKKGRVFFTTISSNISRIQQAINVASRVGRKVAIVGRSIDSKAKISQSLGYLNLPDSLVVDPKRLINFDKDKVMFIISGSYGQPGSALYRTALGEHDFLSIEESDVVIFSSDPAPPGSKGNVDFLVDKLIELGAEVHYYDIQEDLHVSGHASQEDIKLLLSVTKPKYAIPIGGTIRHMRAFTNLAESMGIKRENVFELKNGESVNFRSDFAQKGEKIDVKSVLVDGLGVGDVGQVVLRDRNLLAKEGVAIVLLQFDDALGKLVSTPEIISRGFVFDRKSRDFLERSAKKLDNFLKKKKGLDRRMVKSLAADFLEHYFYKETGRRPMVLPVVAEI
ncbi:MAG: ribonuclease J [Patescibacteria group bacterium]|nr:MAG: ribonuclease J [Patescibacteria group bacterium]